MKTQLTPAERAYTEFAAHPLAQLAGVDRASFIAGYETANSQNARLIEALRECIAADNSDHEAKMRAKGKARALLAKIAQEGKS